MSTLICQVKSQFPVGIVAMFGTLDSTSAARMMVALRDVLAGAPTALIIDAEHLVVTSETGLRALLGLVTQSHQWPGSTVSMCGTTPIIRELIRQVGADGLAIYGDIDVATEAATALPVPPRQSLTLDPVPTAPAESRRFAHDVCGDWGVPRVANLAELVASELVTNAVTHARTPMTVTLRLLDDTVSVDVRDADPRPMFRPNPGSGGRPGDEHGRGLLLLDAMADAWGTSPTADGKVVWANIGVRKPLG